MVVILLIDHRVALVMSELRQRSSRSTAKDEDRNVDAREPRSAFSLADIARMLLGLVVLNFMLSYYVTRTPLWGSETRLTNPRYLKFIVETYMPGSNGYLNLTEQELALYNGQDLSLPIYVALNGTVYDVTSNPGSYGPIGAYSFFSGRDAARAYVTGCFKTDLTHDLRGLDHGEANKIIAGWQAFYESSQKYWKVGYVHHPPLSGEPPAPCQGRPAPAGVTRN